MDTDRRLADVERDVGRLQERVEGIPVLNEQNTGLRRDMTALAEEVGGLRRALIGFALSVAGSAALVVYGLSQAGG